MPSWAAMSFQVFCFVHWNNKTVHDCHSSTCRSSQEYNQRKIAVSCSRPSTNSTYLEITSPFLGVQVQTKEIEGIFRYCRTLCDRRALLLHEVQQLVEKYSSIRVFVHLVEPWKAIRAPWGRLCIGENTKQQLVRVLETTLHIITNDNHIFCVVTNARFTLKSFSLAVQLISDIRKRWQFWISCMQEQKARVAW